jgi:hypothetical protein
MSTIRGNKYVGDNGAQTLIVCDGHGYEAG